MPPPPLAASRTVTQDTYKAVLWVRTGSTNSMNTYNVPNVLAVINIRFFEHDIRDYTLTLEMVPGKNNYLLERFYKSIRFRFAPNLMPMKRSDGLLQ